MEDENKSNWRYGNKKSGYLSKVLKKKNNRLHNFNVKKNDTSINNSNQVINSKLVNNNYSTNFDYNIILCLQSTSISTNNIDIQNETYLLPQIIVDELINDESTPISTVWLVFIYLLSYIYIMYWFYNKKTF